MKCPAFMLCSVLFLACVSSVVAGGRQAAVLPHSAALVSAYGQCPLQFEPNVGQTDKRVKFLTHSQGATLFLTGQDAVLSLSRTAKGAASVLRMHVAGASASASTVGMDPLPGKVNYFVGKDPKNWHANIPTYRKVAYRDIYKNVDLVYYGSCGRVEYDFVVKPGGDPSKIALSFTGAKSMRLASNGDLVLGLNVGDVLWRKPALYQQIGGKHVPVTGAYLLSGGNRVRFAIGAHDASRPLTIDPPMVLPAVLLYSTFLNGSGNDAPNSIAVDNSGCAYVAGFTPSSDYPVTSGAFQSTNKGVGQGTTVAFVSKLSADGSSLAYSTYLGGSGSSTYFLGDKAMGIAVDSSGCAYVTGCAQSSDFPVTSGAFQTTQYGYPNTDGEAFVTKLSADGSSLVYSTLLGGSGGDQANGIALDASGSVYVAGYTWSSDFPVTSGAFQAAKPGGPAAAFASKLSADGSSLAYSTYIGGRGDLFWMGDVANAIAVDASGSAYITGCAGSSNFPVTTGAFQTTNPGIQYSTRTAFVSKLSGDGGSLAYSTYLGGSGGAYQFGDGGLGIALDDSGSAYVTGYANSTDFPVTSGALQTVNNGDWDASSVAFVSKLSADGGSLVYSTYLGGSGDGIGDGDDGYAIAVDRSGAAYVTGSAFSNDFPVTSGALQTTNNALQHYGCAAILSKLTANGTSLTYSTYLSGGNGASAYGIAIDASGSAYLCGSAWSNDFPVTSGAFQSTSVAFGSDFVAKMGFDTSVTPTSTTVDCSPNPAAYGVAVTIVGTITPEVPDGETVTFYDNGVWIGTGSTAGSVASLTISTLSAGSNRITACYYGNANFGYSVSNPVTQTVIGVTSSTSLASLLNPAASSALVTLNATISPSVPDGETVTFYNGATSIGTGTTLGSVASLTISTLAMGDNSITASYPGDNEFTSSTSDALDQIVNPSTATSTALLSSTNPEGFGVSVTFTATVAPSVPDGETVTFYNGGTSIGTGNTLSSVASLSTTALSAGSNSITAIYSGDATFASSTSSALTQTVNPLVTITIGSSENPSTFGDSVMFTATISPAVPDGETVMFWDNMAGKNLGTGTTSGGMATLTTAALDANLHYIDAQYAGDGTNSSAWSGGMWQIVNQTTPTITVGASANPSIYGRQVTFTATTSPAVLDGETVAFFADGTLIGTGLTSGGVATLTTPNVAAGSHDIDAQFAGDSNCYSASASGSGGDLSPFVVDQASAAVGIKSSPNPAKYSANVLFTAWVRPVPADGETITFYDGATSIGTGATSGGLATLSTAALCVGSHAITAGYPGDSNILAGTSSAVTQTVVICHPTTALTSTVSPSPIGTSVTFTATISPSVPDGETVTFYDGATIKSSLGSGTTSGGQATLSTASLAAGIHTIWAYYSGDGNYAYSWSSSLTQIESGASTTTSIKSSLNPSCWGAPATLTAWVRPIPPDGETVTFYDGGNSIGTGTTSGGNATLALSTLAVGSHNITAEYMGDVVYKVSTSASLTQTVVLCHPATTLASSINPSALGSPVTFAATVKPFVPDGETVTFYDGAVSKAAIGSSQTSGGVATLATSALALGTHTIWAQYAGDANNAYSWSNSVTQIVNKTSPVTTLSSSPNPSIYGASVKIIATLSPSVPNGEIVTFYDGAAKIGTGNTCSGIATLSISTLAKGSHSITASYPGDAICQSSISCALSQTVNGIPTTTGIKSTPSSSCFGTSVTFTAWLRPIVADSETITFHDGANVIGTVPTSGGNATFSTASLAAGSHSITASYPGDATYAGSTSAILTQSVAVIHPITALTSSLNPSPSGSSVTFTATVSPSVPDGETVNFYDGATSKTLIGTGTISGGVATFTTSKLAKGSHTIWADYVGDPNYAYSWSNSLTQTVN